MRKRRWWIFGFLVILLVGGGWWSRVRAPAFPVCLGAFESQASYLGSVGGSGYATPPGGFRPMIRTVDHYLVEASAEDVLQNVKKHCLTHAWAVWPGHDRVIFGDGKVQIEVRPTFSNGGRATMVTIQRPVTPSPLDGWIIANWPSWIKFRYGNASIPKYPRDDFRFSHFGVPVKP